MYSIKLLDIRSMDEYRDTIYDGSIDSCLINEHDNWNNYYVGHRQTMGRQIVGTIVGVYTHHESGSAWIVIRTDSGMFMEVDVDYD